MTNYEKLKIALEWQLIGLWYNKALKAFNLAKKYHNWLRKDWVTNEFKHQVDICLYLLTLKVDNSEMEDLITSALLHDIREDYGIEHVYINDNFWNKIATSVEKLTKKFNNIKKPYDLYFDELANDYLASLVKWADRINNISTMVWVFSTTKQLEYVKEVEVYFLPMLKKARKNFPENTLAYLNIETILKQQVFFIKEINKNVD